MAKAPWFIVKAYAYGLMRKGWNLRDYVVYAAVANDGYEVIVCIGVQRSGKSNESLQIASWAKQATLVFELNHVSVTDFLKHVNEEKKPPSDFIDAQPIQPNSKMVWERVLDCIQFTAGDFVSYLKDVPENQPTDVVIWDDISGHYTNMSFRIDPESYAQVDSAFTVLGTKARIIITNIPNINRLTKNVKDHMTVQIFIGRNKLREILRVFRLTMKNRTNMSEYLGQLEKPTKFDIYAIPEWAWRIYEDRRIKLAQDVFESLSTQVDQDHAPEGYISVAEAVKLARDNGLNWGVSTVQQGGSRGLWKKASSGGFMFIEKESFEKMIEAEAYRP